MKYRPHKGGLEESMKELVEVNSLQELTDVLNKYTNPGIVIKPSQVIIQKYGWGSDDRIGWKEVYSVSVQWHHLTDPTKVAVTDLYGFSDSNTFDKQLV